MSSSWPKAYELGIPSLPPSQDCQKDLEFRAGDAKKVGGPTKHETHLTPIAASIILILFFTAGRHDFLLSTCMKLCDDIIRKSTKYHGNLHY